MTDTSGPKLTILGVYRPEVSDQAWQEQLAVTGDESYTRERFAKLVLIEAVAEDLTEPFAMGTFGEMSAEFPDDLSRMGMTRPCCRPMEKRSYNVK